MTDEIESLLLNMRRELGDAIRAGKAYVVANPSQVWAINMVERWRSDFTIIQNHMVGDDPIPVP